MMKKVYLLILILFVMAAPAMGQTTLFYLNFDNAADQSNIAQGTPYTPGVSEVSNPGGGGLGTASFAFINNAGNGPSIGSAPGGLIGTRQGGKVLLTDSGAGQDEGMKITVANGLANQSFTLEVVWYTIDNSGGSNTAGIQSMIGNEWPFGEVSQFFIRSVGANRFDYWTDRGDSNGERVWINTVPSFNNNTWYHDVIVYTYNSGTPASSQIEAFRNGVSQGTSVYNASAAPVAFFGAGYLSQRQCAIGLQNSMEANPADHRGLNGGIDAIAITTGALTPANFVLPAGVPLDVTNWSLY